MSFLGFGSNKRSDDTEALLPQYEDDTDRQRRLHQKMHTYQMLRALSMGYMPTNEQLIINLRTLLASDLLDAGNPDLSDAGRRLVKFLKEWLQNFIELLVHKNERDQIQDFIWYALQARVSLDPNRIAGRAKISKTRADATAAYQSLRTVGSLLLTNSDFRLFLGDLNTIGRQVFADTAFSISNIAGETAKVVEPSEAEAKALTGPGADAGKAPTTEELAEPVTDVAKTVGDGLAKTGQDALASAKENLSGDQKETVLNRLKESITKLREKNDYTESVSTIGLLIERYAKAYSRAADSAIGAVQTDVETNDELDQAAKNLWLLVSSFGDKDQWAQLQEKFNQVLSHSQKDPEFESLMVDVGNSLQKLLTDPSFFESANEQIDEIKEKSERIGTESSLRKDVDDFLVQARTTLRSTLEDKDVASLIHKSQQIVNTSSPPNAMANEDLFSDAIRIFLPAFINLVQHVPIPRLEVSTPEIDLLLENLILEPGHTINHSSFLPYKLHLTSTSDLILRKARFSTLTTTSTIVTIHLSGLTVRADEVGFWMKLRAGLLRFTSSGIASLALDDRGLDITLEVEVGKERLEKILSLKSVKVHAHKLSYKIRKSKLGWFAWLLTPLLNPLLKRTLESQLGTAIGDLLHAANREIVFARERLRATRIADPDDLRTFAKAVMTRLTPRDDPDVYTAIGVRPSAGRFKGRYAPGSLVKVWEEEGRRADEVVEDEAEDVGGGLRKGDWRNTVFDVRV